MVKKDKKVKEAEKKKRVAQKQEKKSVQKEKKAKGKKNDDSDAEEVDLDAVLAEYAKQQEQFLKVTETVTEPPSARASSTLIASPANDNELFLYGGEYYNGSLARFYNNLFIYNINRDEWKLVTSPNTPLPRSGHAWCRGGNTGGIYLFGGEFSSPKQGTFYHYNDFWRLEPVSREWTRVESKKGPPARSGHRMTYYKNYIVLFGGFQDTSQQTKYLQDIWLYDCTDFKWHNPAPPPTSQKPDARSSFTFLPHDSGAVLYGGYSRVKASTATKSTKGGGSAVRDVLKPMVHQDTWFLRVTVPTIEGGAPTVRWERRKKPASAPLPTRAGATMAYHKGRGIQFGGVHDVEASEEGIESEFFNTLYVWNVDRNRYFPLALRRARAAHKKRPQAQDRVKRGRGKADEEDLLRNLAALEARDSEQALEEMITPRAEEDHEGDIKPEKPVLWEMPHSRFNAQLAVQDDVLYIFGGTFEKGDQEYTFDELWSIDLGKLDGVKQIFKRELEAWAGSDEEDSDGEWDDSEEEDDEDETEISEQAPSLVTESDTLTEYPVQTPTTELSMGNEGQEDEQQVSESALTDSLPHPRPFESLKEFYARTSIAWQDVLLEEFKYKPPTIQSVKEIRKGAFERAEEKWWDCREEIRVMEDEQEAAGIGEVMSLADKAAANAGSGRRR